MHITANESYQSHHRTDPAIVEALEMIPTPARIKELQQIRKQTERVRDARKQTLWMSIHVRPEELRWMASRRLGLLRQLLKDAAGGFKRLAELDYSHIKKWLWSRAQQKRIALRTLSAYAEDLTREVAALRDPDSPSVRKAEGQLLRRMATLTAAKQAVPLTESEVREAYRACNQRGDWEAGTLCLALWATAGRLASTLDILGGDVRRTKYIPPGVVCPGNLFLRLSVRNKGATDAWKHPVFLPLQNKTLLGLAARKIWSWTTNGMTRKNAPLWSEGGWRRLKKVLPKEKKGIYGFRRGRAQKEGREAAVRAAAVTATAKVCRHRGRKSAPTYLTGS